MAAVFPAQGSLAPHAPIQATDLQPIIKLLPRPNTVVISPTDFSYGQGDIEVLNERYLTPYHIHGAEKPFFQDYEAPRAHKNAVKPKKQVSLPIQSSLVKGPRSDRSAKRAGVRWRENLEEYSDDAIKVELTQRHPVVATPQPQLEQQQSKATKAYKPPPTSSYPHAPTPAAPMLTAQAKYDLSNANHRCDALPESQSAGSSHRSALRAVEDVHLRPCREFPPGCTKAQPVSRAPYASYNHQDADDDDLYPDYKPQRSQDRAQHPPSPSYTQRYQPQRDSNSTSKHARRASAPVRSSGREHELDDRRGSY